MNKFVKGAALAAAIALPAAAAAQDFYRLATLGPGSSPYMVMSTFAQIVNERLDDVEIQVNATGVATAHTLETAQGNLDFYMMAPIVHELMLKGEAMFASIPQAPELAQELRGVLIFPLGPYHFVTMADSGIETLADVEGHTVFLGPPGGSARRTVEIVIESATGLKAGEDYTSVDLGWDAAAQAFQDGRIDLYANPTLPPSPVIEQMALSRDIRIIGLNEADLQTDGIRAMVDRAGGALGTIPAGAYGDQPEQDVATLSSWVGIGTRADLPEDRVYEIVKAFWEGAEAQRSATPWLRNVTLEQVFTDMNMPLHPGALRYYEEIGLDIPDDLRPAG